MDFLCLDFINIRFGTAPSGAPWPDEDDLRRLCAKWALPEPEKTLQAPLVRLHAEIGLAAREFSASGTIDMHTLDGLNAHLEPVQLRTVLERRGTGFYVNMAPQCPENTLLPYRIVLSFASLVSGHEAGRLKICENPDCGWIFYDQSKSRTRRWCANTCASLIKVRRFRKKQAGA